MFSYTIVLWLYNIVLWIYTRPLRIYTICLLLHPMFVAIISSRCSNASQCGTMRANAWPQLIINFNAWQCVTMHDKDWKLDRVPAMVSQCQALSCALMRCHFLSLIGMQWDGLRLTYLFSVLRMVVHVYGRLWPHNHVRRQLGHDRNVSRPTPHVLSLIGAQKTEEQMLRMPPVIAAHAAADLIADSTSSEVA